ncbi:MAG TPA: SHOCT domain-containing protein [Acidimicrobiia bacterium]|nr:SHOCT domain-containing protein [Acidimicrobiia bacterium]
MWYWHGMGWWGWLMMVAFWVLVVLLVVWAVRSSTTGGSTEPKEKDPRGILDERFARGEIDPEEYQERRAVLETQRRT